MRNPAVAAPEARASARNRAMDTVRFGLIAAVMAYHYTVRWRPPHNPHDLYGYTHSYSKYVGIGAYGVHIFFMISGCFVACALAKYADGPLFLYRRPHRIYPAFLVCCTLTFALVAFMRADFQVGPGTTSSRSASSWRTLARASLMAPIGACPSR